MTFFVRRLDAGCRNTRLGGMGCDGRGITTGEYPWLCIADVVVEFNAETAMCVLVAEEFAILGDLMSIAFSFNLYAIYFRLMQERKCNPKSRKILVIKYIASEIPVSTVQTPQ
jgi:hypothetical protein